jgi:hypothetical protein
MNPDMPPSELIVAHALQSTLQAFITVSTLAPDLTKILAKYCKNDPPSDEARIAA